MRRISPLKYNIDFYPILFILTLFTLQILACIYLSHLYAGLAAIAVVFLLGTSAAFNHHHQHCNTFHQPFLNRLFELILGLQTGLTSYMWVLHHNIGHHKYYLDQKRDTAFWKDLKTNRIIDIDIFTKIHYREGFKRIKEIGQHHPMIYRKYLFYRYLYYCVVLGFIYFLGANFILVVLIPSLIVVYYTIQTTWHHHSGLDADDHFSASRNNTSRLYNMRTCNLGYHTAHHLQPSLHWSELPMMHHEIENRIPPDLIRSYIWRA